MVYAIPALMPSMITSTTTTGRFGISAISASGTPAAAIATPNSRRLLKSLNTFTPADMPTARPRKIAANTMPQPVGPPFSVLLT